MCMQEIYQNLAKKVTNMDIWSKWTWQKALGPLGSAAWPHKGITRPPSGPTMSPIRGSCSRANDKHPFKSV